MVETDEMNIVEMDQIQFLNEQLAQLLSVKRNENVVKLKCSRSILQLSIYALNFRNIHVVLFLIFLLFHDNNFCTFPLHYC